MKNEKNEYALSYLLFRKHIKPLFVSSRLETSDCRLGSSVVDLLNFIIPFLNHNILCPSNIWANNATNLIGSLSAITLNPDFIQILLGNIGLLFDYPLKQVYLDQNLLPAFCPHKIFTLADRSTRFGRR